MTTHDIRQKFLSFFEQKGHTILPSASLLPENDPTTLFTGSGMQPMVPYLLGETHPSGKRLVDSQTCFRSQDIEEVGDNRHTTFFEMLGNWSLGDFFKREQITWMFEFLTKEIGLDPRNLYVTVFRGSPELNIPRDTEAIELWKACFASTGIEALDVDDAEEKGMQGGRIFSYPEKKNWWSRAGIPSKMPVGEPGGPDTEMFWDFSPGEWSVEHPEPMHAVSAWKDEPCHVNCDCGRFLEIGNNVFMQYRRTENGFELLPQANVDFGGGLERIAAARQGNPDVFLIDLFEPIRKHLEQLTGRTYQESSEMTTAFRVILDHVRAATFLIADGASPSNKDQGYFTRRLLRRAVRYGRRLGLTEPFLANLAADMIATYGEVYPHLVAANDRIVNEMHQEEEKFLRTLETGLKQLERLTMSLSPGGQLPAEPAFDLYQSYGFPEELIAEELALRGLTYDAPAFAALKVAHADLSRAGSEQKFAGGLADHSEATTRLHTATHLLHQALRHVLGPHVEQRGSNITPERLRFDFSHPAKLTPEELAAVEAHVNNAIQVDVPIRFELLNVATAKERGAIGLFEDKYATLGDQVKVYFMEDLDRGVVVSREVCGGPHANRTGELGHFRIAKEEAVSAGIRRIKAILEVS